MQLLPAPLGCLILFSGIYSLDQTQTSLSVPVRQEDEFLVTATACQSAKLYVVSGSATDYLHLGFLLHLLNTFFFFNIE